MDYKPIIRISLIIPYYCLLYIARICRRKILGYSEIKQKMLTCTL